MAPRAMSDRARLFIVPLVVLSVLLVALVVAIVVVLVVRGTGSRGPAADGIDPCVVGTWRMVTHREDVTTLRFGEVTFTSAGPGATVRLNRDGTGVTDYGAATRFEGAVAGHAIRLDVTGQVTYHYAAERGTIAFQEPDQKATGIIFLDGAKSTEIPFTTSTDPADYACSGDHLTIKTRRYETTLDRVSR